MASKRRIFTTTAALLILLVLLFLLSLVTGSVSLSFDEVWDAFFGSQTFPKNELIVLQLRLPRALSAVFLGGALSVSGFLLQTFFRNPIAGPYILGVSSGAKLLVAMLMICSVRLGFYYNSWAMILAALLGALGSLLIVLFLSSKVEGMAALIVCGIMIGYVCSAATELLVAFAQDSQIANLHNWSMGSFSGITP
ncbi:MAG: iron chelate uptake ABC transporter family permease subunit, partial [Lachnospiraceae bacterium]|nr:iron chelate uptake ABC transporter family permease subunit [Lachnospiraceae bacterium]